MKRFHFHLAANDLEPTYAFTRQYLGRLPLLQNLITRNG